ncbi:MAG: nicotinate-nucleotide--dimethylbenzimidazole phosphoribosyltransferase [Lachnospiraceae bacterium]|nr:nicotinate-nucleotide--dimethylbenzimidazole phosphoribosyltransferase [Lachnospiraceae bacterium]
MKCLENPIWNDYTREELRKLKVDEPDEKCKKNVLKNWDAIAKPLDGMGKFETLIAKIGAITGTEEIDITKKAVVIMCADNGIVEEGVSQSGQEVTVAIAKAMGKGQSCVGQMSKAVGADTIPIDIGINSKESIAGVISRKVRCGTRNFRKEPAMTETETLRAIAIGIEIAFRCKNRGYQILATGELGIGNTTTSSAIAAALLKSEVQKVTGRGAGLNDTGLARKQKVIEEAIQKYDLYHADALTVLQTVGGFDIAGLVGLCIGGAMCHLPVVLDGVISMIAALLAERLVPGIKEYYIPSHKGKEPAIAMLTKELELEPVIDGNLALGEGTGAVMMFALLDVALSIYQGKTTFNDMRIEQYERLN